MLPHSWSHLQLSLLRHSLCLTLLPVASAAAPALLLLQTSTCEAYLRTLASLHLGPYDPSLPAAGPTGDPQQARAGMAHSRVRLCRVALLRVCGSDGPAPVARPHPGQPGGGVGACGACAPASQALPAATLLPSHTGAPAVDTVWWLGGRGLCTRVVGAVSRLPCSC